MVLVLDRIGSWAVVGLRLTALFGGALVGVGQAQVVSGPDTAVVMPAETLEGALHEMSDAAGAIFAGQVMSVRRVQGEGPANPSSGAVEVLFQVDQAVRGCVAGGSYVLREWGGLWATGEPRYRVGQRLLMILRAPGAGGLSSPVGGMDGAIPIRGAASEIAALDAGTAGAAAASAPVQMVDLRWVGARALRDPKGPASGTGASSPSGAGSVATQGASVDAVVGMLRLWELTRAAR